jgi:hypothetical protein
LSISTVLERYDPSTHPPSRNPEALASKTALVRSNEKSGHAMDSTLVKKASKSFEDPP